MSCSTVLDSISGLLVVLFLCVDNDILVHKAENSAHLHEKSPRGERFSALALTSALLLCTRQHEKRPRCVVSEMHSSFHCDFSDIFLEGINSELRQERLRERRTS